MKLTTEYIKNTYHFFKSKYWSDPVWSKVISAGIIALLGTIYLLLVTFFKKISFTQAFEQLFTFFNRKTYVYNFVILICILFFTVWLLIFLKRFIKKNITNYLLRKKTASPQQAKEELKIIPFKSTLFFADRIASAFPGQRGLIWFNDPKTIVDRLVILFKYPLQFKYTEQGYSTTPLWWFRDMKSMFITDFEKLSKTKILLGINELEIKRLAVNIDPIYSRCFIYLETKGEKPTGLTKYTDEDIKQSIEYFGFCWEEYGLFNGIPIRREEYDDGAAIIKSKVVETFGAKLRLRYLSDYNILIASHDSPLNSKRFQLESKEYFNDILANKISSETFIEFLLSFK